MIDSASKAPVTSNSAPQGPFPLESVQIGTPEENEPWWAFLQSTRFWVMILGALSVYLETKGWIGEAERNLLASIAAIFITVRTIDRASERV